MDAHWEGYMTSRRDFIKSGMTGLAGAALVPAANQPHERSELQTKERPFIYRTLGKTGIKLPIVSMGTYDATGVAEEALRAGIKHVDTSADYNEGNDEKMFGRLFQGRPRNSFVIGTSIGMWKYRSAEQVKAAISPEKLEETLNQSLGRLQLDFIDIFYLGGVQHKEIMEHEPYLKTLGKLKQSGKVKFVGVTTHANEPEIIRLATDIDVFDVVLTRYNFRVNHLDELNQAAQYAADNGMGVVAMKTQAGVYWDKDTKKELINPKAALKWALQNENIHTAIPSFRNVDQMYEALSVMEDLPLTEKEKADLKLDSGPPRSATGLFCSHCNECIQQCPHDLDIPTFMRAYMYAYGHEQLLKAQRNLNYVDTPTIPCDECSVCRVHCPSGFDVKNKVMDIARLRKVPEEFLRA
jgi:predicted aldo/keto reductase-like oxidoreductase